MAPMCRFRPRVQQVSLQTEGQESAKSMEEICVILPFVPSHGVGSRVDLLAFASTGAMAQPFYGGPGGPGGPTPGYMGGMGGPQGMPGGPPTQTYMQGPGMGPGPSMGPGPGMAPCGPAMGCGPMGGPGMGPGGMPPMQPGMGQGMPGGCPSGPPQYTQGCGGAGFAMPGMQGPTIETFVEVSPEIQPAFRREQDGTYSMQVPRIRVRLTTNCSPPPPAEPGLAPFKPYEEFWVDMPEVSWVVFNPWAGTPPGGTISAQAKKRGAVLEVSPQVTLNAKLKANSPYGTLVVEDYQVDGRTGMQQKVGETPLTYQLKVEGALSVNKGAGNMGSNRLEVDLSFYFTASMSTKGSAA
eukprot:s1062_g2.t1